MMGKIIKVMLFLAFIWLLSYLLAGFFFESPSMSVSSEQIAVIPVSGMITMDGSGTLFSSTTSGEDIVDNIKLANENDAVKGIVLEINSPGGTVMGSKVVVDALKDVDKPVVAVITEYGTSGAYWIASQADTIVADDLSIIGSIGVLGSYLEFSGLLSDYNVSYQRLVTGDYKDISTPYREMTEEEEMLIQARLDGIHDYFVKDVAEGRGMSEEEISELANGIFYLGYDGLDNGLVDSLGNKDDAINLTKEMAGITDGEVQEYVEEEGWLNSFWAYSAYSSFYIGQGIGSVLVSTDQDSFSIKV